MGLQIFFKIAQSTIFALLLTGCAHSVSPNGSPQDTSVVPQPSPALWHDGSTGGLYGIGEGWSIKIQNPEFETIQERISGGPATTNFIVVNADREWVKHDGEVLGSGLIMERRHVMIPAEYEMVTETIVVEPQRTEYHLTDAIYGPAGDIITPKTVKLRIIPAVTKQQERRVMTVPKRVEKRVMLVEPRKGYRRAVKTLTHLKEFVVPSSPRIVSRKIIKQPYQFMIKNPDGEISHVFDDFDDLTSFVDSLNQPIGALSGKTFKIVKVNDYVLPKEPPHIRARFQNGEIHLIGTCNATYGNFELTGDIFTLSAMKNIGQHACTELFEMPDGRKNERTAQTADVITEDAFIALGNTSLKIQSNQNIVYFTDQNGNTLIILER